MLSDYKKKRDNILNHYAKIVKMDGLLPIEGYSGDDRMTTDDDVREKMEQLKEEHFFVSITGQIKSGKSTLINALIFADQILPADDSPHTAKITLLKYAEDPKIEVLFYSQKEWNELKNSEYFKEYIEDDVNNSIAQGIYPKEVVKEPALLKEDSIGSLKEYVAKGGRYTPYVNLATIYYPNEVLKEITIVDTPGINDPNKIRDRVAKDWINKTNANLYVIYAGQAFSSVDIEFMDKYLLSVPKEQKITAINKIDIEPDGLPALKSWITDLSRDEDLCNREIFDKDSKIVYVSALAALIDKMEKSGKELDDELDEQADMLDEIGYLDPTKHNIQKLEDTIEKSLIQNKGSHILLSHHRYIDALFEKKLLIKESELSILKSNIEDLGSSKQELEEKLETIKKMLSALKQMRKDIDSKLGGEIEDIVAELKEKVEGIKRVTIKRITGEIDTKGKIKTLEAGISWIVKNHMDGYFKDLSPLIKKSKEDVVSITNNELTEISNRLRDIDKDNMIEMGSIRNMIYMSIKELEYDIDRILDGYLDENGISHLMEKYKHWWRFNETDEAKEQLKGHIGTMMKDVSRASINIFEDRISNIVNGGIIGRAEGAINKTLREKESSTKDILESLDNKEKLISEEIKKTDRLKTEIEQINKLKGELDDG